MNKQEIIAAIKTIAEEIQTIKKDSPEMEPLCKQLAIEEREDKLFILKLLLSYKH